MAACRRATRCSSFPSGEQATVVRSAARRQHGGGCQRGRVGRPGARPPARRLARRLDRHAVEPAAGPQRFSATLAWLDTEPAVVGRKYWVRHGNRWVQARITSIDHRLDIHTLDATDAHELAVNEIGRVTIETQQPLPRGELRGEPRRRRADRGRSGEQPHQRRPAGEGRGLTMGVGRVVFIGAGPGAADLITLRGARALARADVVLFDALTDPALRTSRRARIGSTSASAASATARARRASMRCSCSTRRRARRSCG